MTTEKHTLEKVVEKLGKFDEKVEEKVHTAMLLSFAQSVYDVMRKDSVPSIIYRVGYDNDNNIVTMEETTGKSLVPKKSSLDISLEDEIFCCNIRDIPLLLEGETGVGKTFGAMKYTSAILKKENYFTHRLSANAFLNNLFSHFQEGKMINGMPVITAKTEVIETTAAGIIDEINRGDSNETLQLFDNEMNLGGKIYKLGVPIPSIKKGKYEEKSGRLKKLLLITAQNPSNADDAKFTQTMQLDAAVDNRLLKSYVGNAAPSSGTTLWLNSDDKKPHPEFLEKFSKRVSDYLNVSIDSFSNIEKDWLPIYAWITDSSRTDKPVLYSALELSDLIIATLSGNLIDYFNYEKKVIKDWNEILKKDIEIKEELQETDRVKSIHEIIDSFSVPIIFRDIVQLKRVADVLSTLTNIKDSLKSKKPLDYYTDAKKYVTVREVAGAATLLARNKQKKTATSPVEVVNEILGQYVRLVEEYMEDSTLFITKFDLYEPNIGIKKIALHKSIRDTIQEGKGVEYLVDKIVEQADILKQKISVSEEIKDVLIVRNIGDMMTLCGFLNQYKNEINPILERYNKKTLVNKVIDDLNEFYYKKQREDAMVMPEIYQHRIQRTLG